MTDRSLGGMRRAYSPAGLAERDLAPTWWEQFAAWFATARAELREANAMVLSTASPEGRPGSRTVLLKGFDQDGFTFFTNLDSRKAGELAANPRAALLFPWVPLERQVAAEGRVESLPDAEADAYFASRPRGSQLGAHASRQSSVIPGREALEEARSRADERWPEGTPVPRPARWGGFLVVPDRVEFWQGRPDRLHDRLRYRRDGERWVVERLAP